VHLCYGSLATNYKDIESTNWRERERDEKAKQMGNIYWCVISCVKVTTAGSPCNSCSTCR